MDKGIEHLVLALNQLGIKTYSSCSGHDGGGEAYIISEKIPDNIIDKLRKLFKSIWLDEIVIEVENKYLFGKDLVKITFRNFSKLKEENQIRINTWIKRKIKYINK